MIKQVFWQNRKGICLENHLLRAVILPDHGGKVVSLVWKPKTFEVCFQNPKPSFSKASVGDAFSAYEACGFEEAFPTVDACILEFEGITRTYPDHGELWSSAFAVRKCEEEEVVLSFESSRMGYHYEKRLRLEGPQLICGYTIRNTGNHPLPALWVCHDLVAYEPGMNWCFPPEVTEVVNVFDHPLLGAAGQVHSYPITKDLQGNELDLRHFPKQGMWKFYAKKPVSQGWCAYTYPKSNVQVSIAYPSDMLPYLGLWATAGGYRGDWNCALEPSDGYYDNPAFALQNGTCPILQPNTEKAFSLVFQCSDLGGLNLC